MFDTIHLGKKKKAMELPKAISIFVVLFCANFICLPTAAELNFKNFKPSFSAWDPVPKQPFPTTTTASPSYKLAKMPEPRSSTALKMDQAPSFSAVFAFGDSTVDAGNNNHITTIFRSNHPPYGRDLPSHAPSGRFTDGRLATDFLVESLKLGDFLPAYFDAKDEDLMRGASFGSAGAGLDDATSILVGAIPVFRQYELFQEALQRIDRHIGPNETRKLVENALFVISVGSNDMIFSFYHVPLRGLFNSISNYQDTLIGSLQQLIVSLYRMGARRFAVMGLPPIGCLPVQRTLGSIFPSDHWFQRTCVDNQNADSVAYNMKVQSLANEVAAHLPGSKAVYVDVYEVMMDMIFNPEKYGFVETTKGCCGLGSLEYGSLCNDLVRTCPDPQSYMFWDGLHPSERTYGIIASVMKNDLSSFLN